jgi:TonB family protein
MKRHVMRALALGIVGAVIAACASETPAAPSAGEPAGPVDAAEPARPTARFNVTSRGPRQGVPLWDRSVTEADYARAYPERALMRDVEGVVALECLIGFDGRLDCSITREEPDNWGFGTAAMSLVATMRAGPRMSNGIPSANQTVDIEFVFASEQ